MQLKLKVSPKIPENLWLTRPHDNQYSKNLSFSRRTTLWAAWWTDPVGPATWTTTCRRARPPPPSPLPRTSSPSACPRPAETTAPETAPTRTPSIRTERADYTSVSASVRVVVMWHAKTQVINVVWMINFIVFDDSFYDVCVIESQNDLKCGLTY